MAALASPAYLAGEASLVPTLVVLGIAVVMIGAEVALPGRKWPRVEGWWARAALLNSFQLGMAFVPGLVWDAWLARNRPWSGDWLGTVPGGILGYVAITFVYYWWHRARHASPLLWRLLHQVHHSPRRIEVITSFYKHPFEIASNAAITSAIVYLGVGLPREAAALALALAGVAEFFYHWNVPTPWWLGFIVQRPESHCVHHQSGLHAYNYGDLPIWDMLFGTFRNPRRWESSCGFGPEREARLGEMIFLQDVATGETAARPEPVETVR